MSTKDDINTKIAERRIKSFANRFKQKNLDLAYLHLAYHAAFPLALTPDLLYRLWANFKQDVFGEVLKIPWVAVPHLLLSSLCDEVGYELYEMDRAVRRDLLQRLVKDEKFGKKRIKELSQFLLAYVQQKLLSSDPYVRDFANGQKWTALAFVEPSRAAHELASELKKAYNEQEKYELVRLGSLIETLAEPLKEYEPLLYYSRGMVNWARNDTERAISEFNQLQEWRSGIGRNQLEVAGVTLDIPQPWKPAPKELRLENKMLQRLYQFKEYGEAVLKGLTSFKENQSLPDEVRSNLSKCLQDLEELAKTTIERATSPVKIAIMGEISSGKTLLLGSLIGYADALPVNEIATTGNVTAIHLVQQEEERTTKVDQFQVEYLSEQGVKECLDYMLLEAEQRAKAARLDSRQLEDLKNLSSTNAYDWDRILQWCEQAWSNPNLELRYLIRELVVFARSYNAYGKHICDKTYKIAQTTAKEGLKLAEQSQNILQMDFSSLPPVPQQWQNLAQPSAQELQNSFSLIRRIDTTVEVSKQIWDLSSLKGSNEFVLLDLPGLGSETSGVRDTFLSLSQIKEVQTFLLVLNGRASAPGQVAAKIRTMIQQYKREDIKDRIIVGVGRFNQLPLNAAKEKVLDDLIDNASFLEPNSQKVLSDLDILKQIINSAENLTSKTDTIVLLSQTFGLAKLAQESRLVEVCSPEFKPELDQVNKSDSDEYKLRQKWQKLGEMLRESEPRGTLGRQLSDFADDGGIGRLRELLQEHVAEHGLKQLYDDTLEVAQRLRHQQNNLKSILEKIQDNPIPENSPAYTELCQAIDNLRTTYRDLVEDLRKQPLLKYNRVPVIDIVKEEVSFRISNWNEWTVLFNSIQDGIIKPASATETAADNLLRRRRKDNNSIPTKSDDFYSTFEKTFEDLTGFVRNRTQDALQELLSELSDKVEPQRHALEKIRHPQMEQQIQQNFGDDAADLFYNLLQADDPNKWLDAIIEKINDVRPQISNSQTLFPLASKDDLHKFGQIFDWSSQKQSSASPRPFNHEFLVLRLRSEMVASASFNLARYVSQLTEEVNFLLLSILNGFINVLLDLSKDEVLLRYIATPDEQTNNPPWLQTLSQIPLISYP